MKKGISRRELLMGGASIALLSACDVDANSGATEGFDFTEHDLILPGMNPDHEGVRILQMSDIHIGVETPDERVRRAVAKINTEKPDIVLLTGDFTTFEKEPIARIPEMLGGIDSKVFAVLGNHDHDVDAGMVRDTLEKTNFTVLQNAYTNTIVRGSPLTIFGVDDGFTKHDDVKMTFTGAPTTGTRLVMAHTPPTVQKMPHGAGLACFSGHTHGGSINIPGITNVISKLWGQPYVRGHFDVNGNQLYVNRGIGFGARGKLYAPRVNSRPEVALFTLRGTAAKAV